MSARVAAPWRPLAALALLLLLAARAPGQDARTPAVKTLLARQPALASLSAYLDTHPNAPADEIGQRLTAGLFGMDLSSATRAANYDERLGLLQFVASDDRLVAALSLQPERFKSAMEQLEHGERRSPSELAGIVDVLIQDIAAFVPPSPAGPLPTAPATPEAPAIGRSGSAGGRPGATPGGVWLAIGLLVGAAAGMALVWVVSRASGEPARIGVPGQEAGVGALPSASGEGGARAAMPRLPGALAPARGSPGSPWGGPGSGPVFYPAPGARASAMLDALAQDGQTPAAPVPAARTEAGTPAHTDVQGGSSPESAGEGAAFASATPVEGATPATLAALSAGPHAGSADGAPPAAGAAVARSPVLAAATEARTSPQMAGAGSGPLTRQGVVFGGAPESPLGSAPPPPVTRQVVLSPEFDAHPAHGFTPLAPGEAGGPGGDSATAVGPDVPGGSGWLDDGAGGGEGTETDFLPSRYAVETVLGRGGMGVVYKAYDQKDRRPVAIKVLPATEMDRQEARDRFLREFGVMMELKHPNIARVYDIGTGQVMYFVMELVTGKDVGSIVVEGILPPKMAVDLAVQLSDALAYAHAKGVLHRDIKPSNLMVNESAQLKVIDFGLARIASAAPLTLPGTVIGSFKFMAPEQLLAESVDARSDVYAVGGTLYYMLTGSVPFEGRNPHLKISSPPTPILERDAALSPALATIVMACLERDPKLRPQTAGTLAKALRGVGV